MPMRVVRFARERWQGLALAALALLVSATLSFEVISSAQAEQARAERAKAQRHQLCRALPKAAAASAQALIDVVVARDREAGVGAAEIDATLRLGVIYVERTRELVLANLPDCPQ